LSKLIKNFKNRSSSIKKQEKIFTSKIIDLDNSLTEALEGIEIYAKSEEKILEKTGPDDWIYGYLSFKEGKIQIEYRSTEDDFHDAMHQVPEEYQGYK